MAVGGAMSTKNLSSWVVEAEKGVGLGQMKCTCLQTHIPQNLAFSPALRGKEGKGYSGRFIFSKFGLRTTLHSR